MNTFEIALKTKQLPTDPKKLSEVIFLGDAAVKWHQHQLKMLKNKPDSINVSQESIDKITKDGQKVGIMLLNAQAKLGELSEAIPQARPTEVVHSDAPTSAGGRKIIGSKPTNEKPKHEKMGLKNRKQLQTAQTIKNNPETVQRVIDEAIANDDIPTKTAVVNQVRYENEKKRRKAAEGKKEKSKLIMKLDEQRYIMALEGCIRDLPKTPPKDWSEQGFSMAQGLADILIKRLKIFDVSQTKGAIK